MALFDVLNAKYPTLPVIIMAAHGTIGDAVAATRRGVFGFVTKPVDRQDLIHQISEAIRLHGGAVAMPEPGGWRGWIVTQSPLLEEVLNQCSGWHRAAPASSSVGKAVPARNSSPAPFTI